MDFYRNSDRRGEDTLLSIPIKVHKLLYIIFIILILLALRVWHLCVVQHTKRVEDAFRPRRKVVIEAAERGTVRDRFNIVLAANRVGYRLAIVYAQIREIPAVVMHKDTHGVNKKIYLRREYIKKFASSIAHEIGMSGEEVEDLIHSEAALCDNIPFILKQDLTEQQYFRLKALEKDLPGLEAQCIPRRYYPYGKVGAHILGYLGPIQKIHYDKLINEIRTLSDYIKQLELGLDLEPQDGYTMDLESAQKKLFELQERAYTINDDIGILGIEAGFESDLRGYFGKRIYFSDAKGNFMRSMEGSHSPVSGKRVLLSMSIELQEFAEKLLAQSEKDRENVNLYEKNFKKEPWIRGGAIVAVDPNTGDVLAMASYPRFNPNDFARVRDQKAEDNALRWIESDTYLAKVWDGSLPLVRELIDDSLNNWYNEEKFLDWQSYLNFILPHDSKLFQKLSPHTQIADLVFLQKAFDEILKRAPALSSRDVLEFLSSPALHEITLFREDIAYYWKICEPWFSDLNDIKEKLLLLDLSRLILSHEDFSPELVRAIGKLSIKNFRELSCSGVSAFNLLKKDVKEIFHNVVFKNWRKANEKEFLKAARLEEKEKKLCAKPYLYYLNKQEKALFNTFWQKWRFALLEFCLTREIQHISSEEEELLAPYCACLSQQLLDEPILQRQLQDLEPEEITPFLRTLKGFSDLDQPLYSTYFKNGKELAKSFIKAASSGCLRSYAFRETTIQGSVFKLVTAYSALKQLYLEKQGKCTAHDLRLFEIYDHVFKLNNKIYVGSFLDGKAIPQLYKSGRVPKSLNYNLGKLDLVKAIGVSSNPYFSLLAGDYLKDPEALLTAARDFGYGEKTGLMVPGEIAGNIPDDLGENPTGLYATAIGQHTLVTTPIQTAMMIAALANGGKLLRPNTVSIIVGKNGVDETKDEVQKLLPTVKREIFLPEVIRNTILEGMYLSVSNSQNERGRALTSLYKAHPTMKRDIMRLKGEFIGKSSTSEVIEKVGPAFINPAYMYRHIWFGGFSVESNADKKGQVFTFSDCEDNLAHSKPEIVVIVYLRYGGYGKEAAPIAAQVIQKWREIKQRS